MSSNGSHVVPLWVKADSSFSYPHRSMSHYVGVDCAALSSPQLHRKRSREGSLNQFRPPIYFLQWPPGRRCVKTGEASPFWAKLEPLWTSCV
ncbi:hypothetical protein TNCT_477241 [Trichonephila clavata]|uniref:Uncharacterized protein n=1 Tax=Trichonephila clavata TaxID=2740835 RepID=A0A8X6H370_TRICU|nr:hypothetical protein TNCT_477241 [Trichonephila clavata]